jgi:membrane protease YdiL (CAAX protease family)
VSAELPEMPEESNTLEVLIRVPTEAEASLIVQCLADQGIAAKAVGGFTSGFRAEAPGDVSVLVRHADLARAKIALATGDQGPSSEQATDETEDGQSAPDAPSGSEEAVAFVCEDCGERITFPGQRRGRVETCPHCGNYVDVPDDTETSLPAESRAAASRPGSAETERLESLGSGSRTSTQLWIEVFAVLCLACIPDLYNAIALVSGWVAAEHPFADEMLFITFRSLQVAAPLLVIMALSNDAWSLFGIVRPRWIADGVGGGAIWLGGLLAWCLVECLLPLSMLETAASPQTAHRGGPEGIARFVLLVIPCAANGFAEELAMRGYLIPRLEQLLRSTWLAVLVSTALFASYHLYQGAAAVIVIAATGLVYAVSFCLFRRLWPLCVAHSVSNILLL